MSKVDLIAGIKELAASYDDYRKAEDFYTGQAKELFGSSALEVRLKKESELYRLNLAKTAVNVVADRLEVAAATVPDNDAATQEIERISTENRLDLHGDAWTRGMCEYGDFYVMAWPELDDAGQETDGVELAGHDPKCMRLIYDPEHPMRKLFGIKRWMTTSGDIRATLYYADMIERWICPKSQKEEEPGSWAPYSDDDVDAEEINPYGEIPIFHFRTHAPYGTPEHRDAYGPQAAVNKGMVTQVSTMDVTGFPTRFALQDPEAVMDAASDDPDWDDDVDATDATDSFGGLAKGSKMRSAPGAVNWLQGVRELVQFEGADPKKFLEPMAAYARLLGQVTDTPPYRLGFTGEPPSGESLKVANLPLNSKVATRAKWAGATLEELWIFVLTKLRNVQNVTAVEIRWKPAALVQGIEDWQIAQAKRDSGVPETQVLLESGYSPDQVQEWQSGDREAMDLLRRATIVKELGAGVQALSAGVLAGVIDAGAVSSLLTKLLDDATPPDDGGDAGA